METVNSEQVIIGFILVCVIMLFWSLWKRQLVTIIIKMIMGMAIIGAVNLILPTIAIGINGLTVGVTGILGIPGIIMLYVIHSLL